MISRVADHCFWFGRYLERTESTARVLSTTGDLALDADLPAGQVWLPVITVAGERPQFIERFGIERADDSELVQNYMTWDEDNFVSLLRSICAARNNARSIRDVVSLEAWEAVNGLYLWMRGSAGMEEYRTNRYGFHKRIRESTQLCLGLLRSTMLKDTPLDFIWLGVLLERVGQTARILDVHHHALSSMETRHQVVDTALWLSLTRACSGFEPFIKLHRGKVTGRAVAGFLILEPRFPRSIRYCVHSSFDRLCHIRPLEEKSLPGGETLARLQALDQWMSSKNGDSLDPTGIHDLLTHVVDETSAICNGLGRELLGYAPPPATESQAQ